MADTVSRALELVPSHRLRIVAGRHLESLLTSALPELPPGSFLWEPLPRSTAPALTWATWRAWRSDPDAVIVSLHSDHVIRPARAFRSLIAHAARVAARTDVLVTVGAEPDSPDTGYGYLQPGDPLDGGEDGGPDGSPRRVLRFHEKPDARRAAEYIRQGFLWNTGIFVWRASVFLKELQLHAPDLAALIPRLEAGDVDGFFGHAPAVSVDEAVLERSRACATLPASFYWDDVGSWEALARTGRPDGSGNTRTGDVVFVESEDNIVYRRQAGGAVRGQGAGRGGGGGSEMVTTREHARELKRLVSVCPRLRGRRARDDPALPVRRRPCPAVGALCADTPGRELVLGALRSGAGSPGVGRAIWRPPRGRSPRRLPRGWRASALEPPTWGRAATAFWCAAGPWCRILPSRPARTARHCTSTPRRAGMEPPVPAPLPPPPAAPPRIPRRRGSGRRRLRWLAGSCGARWEL